MITSTIQKTITRVHYQTKYRIFSLNKVYYIIFPDKYANAFIAQNAFPYLQSFLTFLQYKYHKTKNENDLHFRSPLKIQCINTLPSESTSYSSTLPVILINIHHQLYSHMIIYLLLTIEVRRERQIQHQSQGLSSAIFLFQKI